MAAPTLEGELVRLEQLTWEHLPDLARIAIAHPELWRWTTSVIRSEADMRAYMETAFAWQAAGTCLPWAIFSRRDNAVAGSTRFMDISAANKSLEIGSSWIDPTYQRTGINVETKYLLLRHAFESMGCRRVAFKTHHENLKSQTAIRAVGATEEGTFRNHMIQPDGSARHSIWFSIVAEEWPAVKTRLEGRMARHKPSPHASDR